MTVEIDLQDRRVREEAERVHSEVARRRRIGIDNRGDVERPSAAESAEELEVMSLCERLSDFPGYGES